MRALHAAAVGAEDGCGAAPTSRRLVREDLKEGILRCPLRSKKRDGSLYGQMHGASKCGQGVNPLQPYPRALGGPCDKAEIISFKNNMRR